jgi:hypothetical protein
MIKKLINNEKGSAIIIIALGLTAFLGISALVTDGGLLYLTRSRLSNAVDAAALAGAQELPGNPAEAINKAKEFAAMNKVILENNQIEIMNDNTAIKVFTNRNVEFSFAKFIGFDSSIVNGSAVAAIAPITQVDGAVPLGIEEFAFEFGKEYILKVGAGGSEEGWFGALALGGPGSKTYEENLKHGYEGSIKVGDILNVETGNMSNPTKRAIDYRIAQCIHIPYCTVDNFVRSCKRLLKVPVIIDGGHNKVEVVGFSMFLVDQVEGQGTGSIISGKFVKTVTTGGMSEDGISFGLYGVKLTQ